MIETPDEHCNVMTSESSVCLNYAWPATIKAESYANLVTGMDSSDQSQVDPFN